MTDDESADPTRTDPVYESAQPSLAVVGPRYNIRDHLVGPTVRGVGGLEKPYLVPELVLLPVGAELRLPECRSDGGCGASWCNFSMGHSVPGHQQCARLALYGLPPPSGARRLGIPPSPPSQSAPIAPGSDVWRIGGISIDTDLWRTRYEQLKAPKVASLINIQTRG